MAVNTVKKHMQAIATAKDNFLIVFDLCPAAMAIRDVVKLRYVDVNQAWLNTTQFSKGEVIGKTATDLNIIDNYLVWRQTNDISQSQRGSAEVKFRTRQGELRAGLWAFSIIQFNNAPHILTSLIDITEKKQIEQELARIESYNVIGEMAVSIGHEIRNPMTTIRGYIQLLQRRGKLIEYDDTFNVMLDEIDRADSIIKRFLTLAKNKRFDFHPCDLNSIIFSLKPLLEAEALWRGCRLRVEAGDIPVILADEDAIGQVIINLARNGLEAMQQGGELTIKTYRYCDNLILEVKDTGHGIAENLLDKIWKPFFTTKENGTGLGLPVCYRIVEQHGALLEIQSSSEGTSIKAKFNL